jgi:carboxypeptidase Q
MFSPGRYQGLNDQLERTMRASRWVWERWGPGAPGLALFLGVLLLAAGVCARADDGSVGGRSAEEVDRQIISEVKERSEVRSNIMHLSYVIGPRMTGSANLKRANDWTADKFRAYGLEEVRLEPYEIPAGWERGFVHMKMAEPNTGHHILAASRAWTPGTKGRITGEVVFIENTSQEGLNAYKGKLKNAIVLMSRPARDPDITQIGRPRDPAAAGQPQFGRRTPPETPPSKGGEAGGQPPSKSPPGAPPAKGGEAGARGGAPGKGDPTSPLPPRERGRGFGGFVNQDFLRNEGVACTLTDSGKPHRLLNMTGSWRGRDRGEAAEPLPSLFITHEDYKMLFELATRKDGPPPKVELEIQAKIIPGPITVYNTVGEIRGTEKPDEFVVVGAHLDSWDLAQGTTDNGTGSSVVLEAARVLGKLAKEGIRPKRTIRFVLFSGEEQGLHGSRAYVAKHKDEMPKTSMALVHDTGTGRVTAIALQGREPLKPLLEKELPALKELDVAISLGFQGGTDHLSFDSVGVPGFAFLQDRDEYMLTHHSQSDTFDKAKIPALDQGAQTMAITALRVANLPELLPRERRLPRPEGEKKAEETKEEKKTEEKKDR